jgi:hypothetical protein
LFTASAAGAAMAAGPPLTARRARRRCETCAASRSNVNVTICGLLLAALLSYLWYDILTRPDEPLGTPVVTIYNWLTQRAPPSSPRPAPVARQPLQIRVSPIIVTASARTPAPRAHAQKRRPPRGPFRPPPREMDGLY